MKKLDDKQLARIGAAFIVLVAVVWIVWLLATGKAGQLVSSLTHARPQWVLAGMGCFAAYFALDALCFRVSATLTGVRLGAADLVSVAASGIVFGYLTPGNMAAAPAQIVRLSKAGLSVGDASAVQLTRFFIYQTAVTLFGAGMLVAKFPYFQGLYGNVILIAALAFLGHLGIMLMLVGLVFFPNLIRRVGAWGIGLLSRRLHLIKDPQATLASLNEQVDEYAGSVHAAIHHVGIIVVAILVTVSQLAAIYTIPHFVLLALGATDLDLFTDVAAAAFVQLILTIVPLPGGTGGAEGGFMLFFSPQLGDTVGTGVVLWRLISFYLPILVSFPLLACKSRVTPRERLERFGEVPTESRSIIAGEATIAHGVIQERRDKAKEQAHQAQEIARRARQKAGTGRKHHARHIRRRK